jgi:hypothetical protein
MNRLCQQCGLKFDKDHVCAKSCTKPLESWLPWSERLELFKKLATKNPQQLQQAMAKAEEQKRCSAIAAAVMSTALVDEHASKKRACELPTPSLFSNNAVNAAKVVNAASPNFATSKPTVSLPKPSTSVIPTSIFPQNLNPIMFANSKQAENFASMLAEPLSLVKQLLDSQLAEMDDDCKHFVISRSFEKDIRPFFMGRLVVQKTSLPCTVLIDTGASSSFVNIEFVNKNKLNVYPLGTHVQCKSFDGSMASSGNIKNFFKGQLLLPTSNNLYLSSNVSLYVTKLVSADIILVSPWLKSTNTVVGGKLNQIIVRVSKLMYSSPFKSLTPSADANCFLTDVNVDSSNSVLLNNKFSNVFTVESLSKLPPHQKGFDCEVNLKKGAVPPFGKLYNLSKDEQDQLSKYVDENLSKGFIRLFSSSAASPIFYVKVEGKTDCPCLDYCLLNNMTIRDSYPLPLISHLLNNLHQGRFHGTRRRVPLHNSLPSLGLNRVWRYAHSNCMLN